MRVADGIYPIAAAIAFEPEDSGVTFEAAPGAKPVFTGGKKITGWQVGADGVWTAHVAPGSSYEALWVNGQRATRAKYPKTDYIQATGQPMEPLPGIPLAGPAQQTMLKISPKDAEILRGLSPEELHDVNVVVLHSWNESRHRIAGVRLADGTLQFTGGTRAFFSLEPFHRIYFENLRAALTDAGEWFLARNGTLSYKPRAGEKPETADVWAPMAEQWLLFQGDAAKEDALVRDLHFRGLVFQHQAYTLPEAGAGYHQAEEPLGAAIEGDAMRNVSFENCEFAHTMTNTFWLRHGCRDVTVRHCYFHDLGAGGLKIGDPKVRDDNADQTSFVTIDDCIMHTGSRYFLSGIPVLIFHAHDCTVRHCDIADFFYSGISIGWTWGYKPTCGARNVVEECHIHHLGWAVLSDMGAVYTLGPQPGTTIRGCNFHDIGCGSYGGWGMYNDEGSTGIVWENNLIHHTQDAGYHQHYGRGNIVRNCIIAYGMEEHVRRSKPEEFLAFAFERNIVLMGEGRLFMQVDKNWDDGRVFLADNVYWKPDGPIPEFAGRSWQDWQFMGRDTNSVVADPLFVDPDHGDWTLRPESPALKLGFVPFDWKKAGVTGDAAWKQLAAEEFPPMKYGLKPKAPPLVIHDGFEKMPIGGMPTRARTINQKPGSIGVVADQHSKGEHSLQLTDGPDVLPEFNPHFYYNPNHEHGLSRVAFDVRMEAAYRLVHEWRDDSVPYRTGPRLDFEKGAISANGKKLTDLPPNAWVHVEVTAKLGPDSDGTWDCSVTLPGQEAQRFTKLKFDKPDMREMKWLGFSSPGKAVAKCWIDEIEIENTAGQ